VGKTLAILGFGKVGSEVARRAKGLGMHVIAHDPYASADRARAIGVELVSMEEAMTTADFISLHMPLTPATNKMLNDEAFAKMKKGVRIINVARGGVIDEEALVRALDSGIVAQVCLIILTHLLVFHALMKFSDASLRCFPWNHAYIFQFFCILGCS
jgi:D-3-phosphoglycerate dehydrogenase